MKKIGIGYENYKRIVQDNCYYIDKTILVAELIHNSGMVTLFTRPRRFGKTLALSMLQTFFEDERDASGAPIDNTRFFENTNILKCKDVLADMGKYPVIRLSFKSAKQGDFYTAFLKIREEIISEFSRHSYIKASFPTSLDSSKLAEFESFEHGMSDWYEREKQFATKADREEAIKAEIAKYSTSIKTLSEYLKEYHKHNVVILIDEYDVPLENAYECGFYDDMVGLLRSLFESALKTNDALERAVVTGCLRISKESIFTGLNNLEVNSINSSEFGEYFGFTSDETAAMLDEYELGDHTQLVKDWYDGYLFGQCEVYNPWSVTKYIKDHIAEPERFPEPYWSNTSSNSIIKDLIENASDHVKEELDTLISGGSIEKLIHEDVTYADINESEDNLWNFLYFTGYMKKISARIENEVIYMTMQIPNKEILYVYKTQIRQWFERSIKQVDYSDLYKAINEQDAFRVEAFIRNLLEKSISYFDGEESFYHGFFLSLLYAMPNYAPKSNREMGNGRPDIVLLPNHPEDPAYIFELKVRKKFSEMDDGLDEAITQIIDKRYEQGLIDDGYVGTVSYGICFCKKTCKVKLKSN